VRTSLAQVVSCRFARFGGFLSVSEVADVGLEHFVKRCWDFSTISFYALCQALLAKSFVQLHTFGHLSGTATNFISIRLVERSVFLTFDFLKC